MEQTTKWLLKLQYCSGISWKDCYLLLKNDATLAAMAHISPAEYARVTGRSINQAHRVLNDLHSLSSERILSSLTASSVAFIPIYDTLYPEQLKRLPQPPWGLFTKGRTELLHHKNALAVVGARAGDEYGKQALKALLPDLIAKKIAIVSGLAKGIDAFSHEVTLEQSGTAIAVVAGGFNYFYPKENAGLARQIASEGLILSEYAPGRKPEKWQFPARNRIVSGLSKGVLVVQAAKKSGSLITAAFAMEQGMEVFAVPGAITHPLSEGVHALIADGAKMVHCAADILDEMQLE